MFFVFFLVRSLFTAINTKYKCLTESSLAFLCVCFFVVVVFFFIRLIKIQLLLVVAAVYTYKLSNSDGEHTAQ